MDVGPAGHGLAESWQSSRGIGGVAKPQDLEVHRDFMRDFLESTRQAKKAGHTAAAAKAWKVLPRYVGYEAQPARMLGAMEWIYRRLP